MHLLSQLDKGMSVKRGDGVGFQFLCNCICAKWRKTVNWSCTVLSNEYRVVPPPGKNASLQFATLEKEEENGFVRRKGFFLVLCLHVVYFVVVT